MFKTAVQWMQAAEFDSVIYRDIQAAPHYSCPRTAGVNSMAALAMIGLKAQYPSRYILQPIAKSLLSELCAIY